MSEPSISGPTITGTSPEGVLFGMFVPQGWKMELSSIPDAADKWAKTIEVAEAAERLGYDSIWVYDHFHNVPRPAHETVFECWSTIAAISQRTSRIRLGQMVGCNSYRNPGLLAKVTSTVDVMSGGRLEWGIGAGWYENEYRAYGYDFPKPKDRIGMLRESVEIVRSMWTEAETTYKGRYYEMVRANCDPKPLQKPLPPIWIGGGGEQLTLRVVAMYADCSNFGGNPEEWERKRNTLWNHCRTVGRDPNHPHDVVAGSVHPRDRSRNRGRGQSQFVGRGRGVVARRQSGRHTRAGLRKDRNVLVARMSRTRAVVSRLSESRNSRTVRHESDSQLPLTRLAPPRVRCRNGR